MARFSSWVSRPGALGSLLRQARLAVRLFREPRVPWILKSIPVLTLLYVISPIDLIPDFLPVFGQLDDLTMVLVALQVFVRLCPSSAQTHHQEAVARGQAFSPMSSTDEVIEAEWHHL